MRRRGVRQATAAPFTRRRAALGLPAGRRRARRLQATLDQDVYADLERPGELLDVILSRHRGCDLLAGCDDLAVARQGVAHALEAHAVRAQVTLDLGDDDRLRVVGELAGRRSVVARQRLDEADAGDADELGGVPAAIDCVAMREFMHEREVAKQAPVPQIAAAPLASQIQLADVRVFHARSRVHHRHGYLAFPMLKPTSDGLTP